ncbi:hypothetical protein KUL42_08080 [Alteromonas sp. KUL42]|uniref:flagellar hook-length control protein FliK n=1 Tax=Alteromonas sp. KUL42 TaxID=2480797 RepID=UPI001036350B|nr:flagellar hook-length control protein FliK [Alteromonas sp. KUL42]TAP37614.1 flagellar hook-length control protein FliK [Alteromonas sp. KUL42]GEA06047.1 hypothetical protein KUL42_08080 [Alteromonas sp. KUL42]
MQQVAAHKTDLAALPFAATNTAKAVETGIDSQSKNQNSDAFKSLYQEARSSNNNASTQRERTASSQKQSNKQDSDKYNSERQTDGTSNRVDRNENVEREVKKSSTNNQHDVNHRGQDASQGNTANHAQSAPKQGKDKNAGHTDLPTNDKSDDIALSGGTGVSGEGAEDTAVQAIDLHGNPVGGEAQQEDSTDRDLVNGLPVEDSAVEGEPIAGKPGEGDIIVDNPIVADPVDTKSEENVISITDDSTQRDSSLVNVDGVVTQEIANEAEYVIGEGGKKDSEAGRIGETEPEEHSEPSVNDGTLDDNQSVGLGTNGDVLSQEDAIYEALKNNAEHDTQMPSVGGNGDEAVDGTSEEAVDWLSFVESIMNRGSDDSKGNTGVDAINVSENAEHQLESIKPLQPEYTVQTDENNELDAVTTSFEDIINSIEEKDIDAVVSVLEEMVAALQQSSDSLASNTEASALNSNDELASALNSLKALLQKLTGAEGKEPESSEALNDALTNTSGSTTEATDAANSQALTGMPNATETNSSGESTVDIKAIKSIIDSDEILSKLTPEEAFVLKLLGDELPSNVQLAAEEATSYLSELATKLSALNGKGAATGASATSVSSNDTSKTSDNSNVGAVNTNILDEGQNLLAAIAEMPAETAAKATEAFADRMVAAMPTGPQQQVVKSNIIAGINEFQQQVQQGREPGIDLSAIVADATKEAMVSAEVASSMNARVESQASQFLQLVNNTQNTVNQVLQGQLTQADTMINESNQLKAEASKSQQQFEGFDKAVNIHKPEGQQQLNEKIRWMVNARNTMAEIRLDPPEMGSMQVRVNVSGEAASVSFIVQSQQAKDALADAMPKLRDMLAEQGIELGDAQVRKDNSSGSENGGQLAGENGQSGRGGRSGDHDGMEDGRIVEQAVSRQTVGGIDYYA